jgi:hypothetical protein
MCPVHAGKPYLDELTMPWICAVYSFILYAHFAIFVIREITTALGISCFRVKKVKKTE